MTIKTSIGKISASKETLNELCAILYVTNGRTGDKRCKAADRLADEIFNAVDKTGYYDAYIIIPQ